MSIPILPCAAGTQLKPAFTPAKVNASLTKNRQLLARGVAVEPFDLATTP
jgi:hypothetical protein